MHLSPRGRDGSLKRHIRREQVYVLEWRRLIGDVMRFELVAWTQGAHAGLRRIVIPWLPAPVDRACG